MFSMFSNSKKSSISSMYRISNEKGVVSVIVTQKDSILLVIETMKDNWIIGLEEANSKIFCNKVNSVVTLKPYLKSTQSKMCDQNEIFQMMDTVFKDIGKKVVIGKKIGKKDQWIQWKNWLDKNYLHLISFAVRLALASSGLICC